MKIYQSHKKVTASPMSRLDYNAYRGWELPSDENGEDEGYLVEYLDGGESNHPDHKGYISWSPKRQFDEGYTEDGSAISEMNFGQAIEAMKVGDKVARGGWNGKDMFLYHVPDNVYPATTAAAKSVFENGVPYDAYIAMKTAQGNVVPWLASQTDMLSEDWKIIA